jgi:hypothetical protein
MEAFVADPSPAARERAVDRLLASPQYGEQWGRHWLDVVRYADTAGDTADYPVPGAWRYRNYVVDAFNHDKPYDEFIREQIAGDLLAREGPADRYAERVTATGYLAISRRFGFDSENYHHLTIQDTIDTLGQGFLGLSLGCARCHDHKYDPVTMGDYYALYGIFESTQYPFPGSEQKNRTRSLAPLLPRAEADQRWRQFEQRFVSAGLRPPGVLRRVDGLDGDFEMQHIASGGSRGVLVPPWHYEGPVAVTAQAQSPFRSLYAFGSVGAEVGAGSTTNYWLAQALHDVPPTGPLHVNLDFRVGTNLPNARAIHWFHLGAGPDSISLRIGLTPDSLVLPIPGPSRTVPLPSPGQWHSLQLVIDLGGGKVAGTVSVPGRPVVLPEFLLNDRGHSGLDRIGIQGSPAPGQMLPSIEIDNVAVQGLPMPPVSTQPASPGQPTLAGDLETAQRELTGALDGDWGFEFQEEGKSPANPWHPGPNSKAVLRAESQSPFRNVIPDGRLGLHLPGEGHSHGFGQVLATVWKPDIAPHLHVAFDFRCTDDAAAHTGTWRFHVGHSHTNPAIELGLHGRQLFTTDGTNPVPVVDLQPGAWHQVQLDLDLRARRYHGTLATPGARREFEGPLAAVWDGVIDYVFIDSEGRIPGTRSALDVDNFMVRLSPPALPDPGARAPDDPDRAAAVARIATARNRVNTLAAELERERKALVALLQSGPFDMAYAVAEGTPADARIQLRGDPEKPGSEVARGFVKALGGGALTNRTSASGRLELADWLASTRHPLTARVMVNRIWQHHFGRGLVATPNDFGTRGQPPSHPGLLDHLATVFVRGGWSIKALHRRIVLSAAYGQASPGRTDNEASPGTAAGAGTDDAGSFSPFARRRLTAEEIRDAILAVSGALDREPGGAHPFPEPTTWGYSQHVPFGGLYDHDKRSLYLMTPRIRRHPFLALFDGPDPNATTPERRPTTVPTQSLYFLNDPFVHAKSERFAARLRAEADTGEHRIQRAYHLALGRPPTSLEQAEAVEFLSACREELRGTGTADPEGAALAALGRVLFGCNEFLVID